MVWSSAPSDVTSQMKHITNLGRIPAAGVVPGARGGTWVFETQESGSGVQVEAAGRGARPGW